MSRKKRISIIAVTGFVCIAAILSIVVTNLRMHALADSAEEVPVISLQKDTSCQLGTEKNPFVVLEIVPNKSIAEAGYLISGCEPIDMERLSVDNLISTYESRFCGDSGIAKTHVVEKTVYTDEIPAGDTVDIVYSGSDGNETMVSDGVLTGGKQQYGVWYCSNSSITMEGYYKRVADGTGKFKLEKPEGKDYTFTYVGKTGGDYIWVTAKNTENITTDALAVQVWTTRTEKYSYTKKSKEISHNNDLIKSVFGTSAEDVTSQVITVTPEDFNNSNNLKLISQADLIYIHDSHDNGLRTMWEQLNNEKSILTDKEQEKTTFEKNDIPWQAVTAIVNRMASSDRAAMVLDGASMYSDTSELNNAHKLYVMLMQYGATVFKQQFMDTGLITESAGMTNGVYTGVYHANGTEVTKWNQNTFVPGGMSEEQLRAYGVKNPYITESWNIVEDGIYSYDGDLTMLDAFLESNISENSYNNEAFEYYNDYYSHSTDKLSPCEIVKYLLLNQDNKQSLKILEVEPCNEFIYGSGGWELYYSSMFPWFTGDVKTDVSVTTMPTWEFIGSIEDLNSEYDLILFGTKQNKSNGSVGYTDTNLNTRWVNGVNMGLAYISVGDYVNNTSNSSKSRRVWNNVRNDQDVRYSGNDITDKAVKELKSFLNAGKPVVFDSSFFSGDTVNTTIIDKNSKIYEIASLYGKADDQTLTSNIFIKGKYCEGDLKAVLAQENCKIQFDDANGGNGYPTDYSYTLAADGTLQNVQYNSSRTFTYKFQITGKSGKKYGVNLFVDVNGDGMYKGSLKEQDAYGTTDWLNSEMVPGLNIVDAAGNSVMQDELEPNVVYTVSKELADNYQGILPWKLEVYNVDNTYSRNSVIRYTALKTTSNTKEKIKVLQMNLTPDMTKEASEAWNNSWNTGFINLTEDAKFKKYLSCVDEYDVTLTYLKNKVWNSTFGSASKGYSGSDAEKNAARIEAWKSYLDDYDMLILGFNDMCNYTDSQIFHEGFEDFIAKGKSVILSHDIVKDATFTDSDPATVSDFDTEIREIMGQRRYSQNSIMVNGKTVSLLRKDGKYQKASSGVPLPEYFDNSTRLYLIFGVQGKSDRDTFMGSSSWGSNNLTNYVNLINEGQITNYPYKLGDVIKISTTHTQNYQLSMENQDMVVWYCLTDKYSTKYKTQIKSMLGSSSYNSTVTSDRLGRGVYSSIEGDCRNSYYIYNKGNITYTGLGHNENGTTVLPDDEVKLFVNTMISAYHAAAAKPKIEIERDGLTGSDNTFYIQMDEANFSDYNKKMPIKFKIIDNSIIQITNMTYKLQYQDMNGNTAKLETYSAEGDRALKEEPDKTFSITRDGSYYFEVPSDEVKKNGSAEYYLVLTASYIDNEGKTITSIAKTKVTFLPIPLFTLN